MNDIVDLDGIPVSRLGFQATLGKLESWLKGHRFRRVATANVDFLALSQKDAKLRQALQSADLVTADGQPLVWLSRMVDQPIVERVAGSDLILPVLLAAARSGKSVYFVGGSPEVLAIVERRVETLASKLKVAGHYCGHVDLDDQQATECLGESIRESNPDLLLVALGCPKQDLFLARYGDRSGAKLGIGIGASLELLAGHRRRAPALVQRLCLEWLFRFAQEPLRLGGRYLRDFWFLFQLTRKLKRQRADQPSGSTGVSSSGGGASSSRI